MEKNVEKGNTCWLPAFSFYISFMVFESLNKTPVLFCRSPPIPSPASVDYNEDDGASIAKAPIPDDDDDDSSSSCTEKPSQAGDSTDVSSFSVLILTLSETTNFRPFQTERVCRRQF